MEIRLDGMDQLLQRMKSLQENTSGPEMEKAIRRGATVIRDGMRARAPLLDRKTARSTSLEPGALKRGIRAYVPKNVRPIEALIGPSSKVAYVARWLEYGHRLVKGGYSKLLANGKTSGKGREIGFVPARPFLRPAFEQTIASAQQEMQASLSESFKG